MSYANSPTEPEPEQPADTQTADAPQMEPKRPADDVYLQRLDGMAL